ncbi:MAG TPA: NAD-dependent epimerase/dehydratase family protein, partial [Desulfobulbus sp.]|nr:NAD-dependent epimerase/dehydratase family protein [Desulfobulbus sp.]
RIAAGSGEKLRLGNTSVQRDWGWAPEYVEAMWLMLQQDQPEDFIVATGVTCSLQDLVQEVFACVDLDWREHVELNPDLLRPTDIMISVANPIKAEQKLGWKARSLMPDVAGMMVAEKKQQLSSVQ